MKKIHCILLFVILAFVGLLLQSCFLPVSIGRRIEFFVADLNKGDRSNVYLNFHPDLTGDYGAIRDRVFWDNAFPLANRNYSIAIQSTSGSSVSGILSHLNNSGEDTITFEMAQLGQDWQIRTLNWFATLDDPVEIQ